MACSLARNGVRGNVRPMRERLVLQQFADAALPGVDLPRHVFEVLERGLERVGHLRVVDKLPD